MIIPALNEGREIGGTLDSIPSGGRVEKIVVDGGSSDNTVAIARKKADIVLFETAGKARQMNTGAGAASGEVYLFLHADSRLSPGALDAINKSLCSPEVVGGAFDLIIDSPRAGLRLVGRAANLRSRLTGVPYGDQGIFIRRSAFKKLGGYPDIPLMEDLELGRRMKRIGTLVFLSEPILTSSRRWDHEGIWLTTLRNQVFIFLYFLGVDPARLARWYRPVR